tara:strand:- start:1846 stop:3255 length:1410 start_codon:yes stop_codon:yes gene_type:complete
MLRIFFIIFLINFLECLSFTPNILRRNNYMSENIVLKFGGSSLKSESHIRNVAKIINNTISENKMPIIVCSAIDDTTNKLENICYSKNFNDVLKLLDKHNLILRNLGCQRDMKKLYKIYSNLYTKVSKEYDDISERKDSVISFGEILSVQIVTSYLNSIGIKSKCYNSYELGFITNDIFNDAIILESSYDLIKKKISDLPKNHVPIITGFLGKNKDSKITTLGRGGSDLTATTIAKCINAKEVQVWKDVDGIFTCDPKIVPDAKLIPNINYEEASEMALHGAKILHPIALDPCKSKNIPVIVKNSYNVNSNGTIINNNTNKNEITAITSKDNITIVDIISLDMIGISGFVSKVFKIFEENRISVDVISTSEKSISISIEKKDSHKINKIKDDLNKISNVNINKNMSIISIICDANKTSKILSKVFKILNRKNIKVEMISKGISKINISLIINNFNLEKSLIMLHKALFA